MHLTPAEKISLQSLLNAFFRENHAQCMETERGKVIRYVLRPFNFILEVQLAYYSETGRHQYQFPATLQTSAASAAEPLHPWCLPGLLVQDLAIAHPRAATGHRKFLQRFFNSCENQQRILDHLSEAQINALFGETVSFEDAENGLLCGHPMNPVSKSREGFTVSEFERYSPELKNHFELHYFLADPAIVLTESALTADADTLVRENFLTASLAADGIVVPVHPWQAEYLRKMPIIQQLMQDKLLVDLGPQGKTFSATISVRTVFSQHCQWMAKMSLNVAITNSVRQQYIRELTRGIAAHRFWQSSIGEDIRHRYPQFMPMTDPAFICLQANGHPIEESAVLLRSNPFMHSPCNVTPVATLCQDHPLKKGNRFNTLIPVVSEAKQVPLAQAAILWFQQFLATAVEPLLWMFVHYGIAIEGHQQNLLIELHDGLPVKSYYRDNQGYYVVTDAYASLCEKVGVAIMQPFCQGSREFIGSRLTYYLVCNNVFGVINAMGTSGVISEKILLQLFHDFLAEKHAQWKASNYLLPMLLETDTLPFKGNLLTRFYELDELTSPLEQQSVYLEVTNLIKPLQEGKSHE